MKVSTLSLKPGESLFVYTDGTTDAKNTSGELLGEETLLTLLSSASSSGFSRLFDLNSQIDKHIGQHEQYDDITQMVLRRKISSGENKHSITRKAVIENLQELRRFVEKSAEHCGLGKQIVFSFKLVTEEICTNIIKYSFDGEEPGNIFNRIRKEKRKSRTQNI